MGFPSEKTQRTVSERGLDVLQLLGWWSLELDIFRAGEAAEVEGRRVCRSFFTWFISSIQAPKTF